MPNEAQDLAPGLKEVLLGQFRAILRKASPTEEELSALCRAALKLGVDPGPLYLEAQDQVPRPASFDPLPPLTAIMPHGPQAFAQPVDQERISAPEVKQAQAEAEAEAKRQRSSSH